MEHACLQVIVIFLSVRQTDIPYTRTRFMRYQEASPVMHVNEQLAGLRRCKITDGA